MQNYESKYPEIITDKTPNSPNTQQPVTLTVEQLYDLMHHTHKMSDLVSDDGDGNTDNEGGNTGGEDGSTGGGQETVQTLTVKVETLNNEMKTMTAEVNNLIKEIEEIKKNSEAGMSIIDWDATTPGIQDIDGNTIEDDGGGVDATEL